MPTPLSTSPDSPAAAPHKPGDAALLAALTDRIHEFDFFQAVRQLSRISWHAGKDGRQQIGNPVGHDYSPITETVRFRSHVSHSFPPSEVVKLVPSTIAPTGIRQPAQMTVSFLGLTGPAGVLPQHYTQAIIDRLRMKDESLIDFLDLFNHRIISLFYRVWEKYHVPPLMERARSEGRDDLFTSSLFCMVGLGTKAVRNRLEQADEFFLYYSGLFAHYPRNAQSLERLLVEWLQVPTRVKQFCGEWLQLEPREQTCMPSVMHPSGLNCRLGVNALAGQRVWSIENRFRLVLGPLDYKSFEQLLPGRRRHVQVAQVVRTYVGPSMEFDLQLLLKRQEVPMCKLSSDASTARQLGWNTWACSYPRGTDATEPVFACDGSPTR